MYDQILVPTDGSEPATEAAAHGFEVADRHEATVHILYVVEADYQDTIGAYGEAGGITALDESILPALEEEGTRIAEDLAARAAAMDLETVTEVRSGHARADIVAYADEHGIDLIVMGTHGRSGVERLLLGSVTERVLRASDVPVLVVRAADDGTDERSTDRELSQGDENDMSADDPSTAPSRSIDHAIEEAGIEAILRRLSNELGTSIQLGDGTLYEDGDQHTPENMDEADDEGVPDE